MSKQSSIHQYPEADIEYQELLERLNKAYKKDHILVKDSLREMIASTEREIRFPNKKGYYDDEDMYNSPDGQPVMNKYEIYRCITMLLFIAAIGLFNVKNIGMYFGGMVFFAAGLLIAFTTPAVGIIFLFSHGMTGLGLMTGALIGDILTSPIMQDNPQNIYIYFGICIMIALAGTLITIRKNLQLYPKGKAPSNPFIISFYMIYFILIAILPRILPFIYNL